MAASMVLIEDVLLLIRGWRDAGSPVTVTLSVVEDGPSLSSAFRLTGTVTDVSDAEFKVTSSDGFAIVGLTDWTEIGFRIANDDIPKLQEGDGDVDTSLQMVRPGLAALIYTTK